MKCRQVCSWITVILVIGFVSSAGAQDKLEFWPEVNTYVNLTPRTRFYFIGTLTSDRENRSIQGEFGPNFDLYLRPFARRRLRDLDPAKNKFLLLRVGYRYFTPLRNEGTSENRGVAELTPRFPLPAGIVASDRNRVDLRWISGSKFSWRYRNRLTFERSFTIRSYSFTPYLRGEIFYDSRFEKINKNSYTIGASFPLTRHTELEPYFEDQNDYSDRPAFHTRAVGLALNLFF
jgi:hypothetical protein